MYCIIFKSFRSVLFCGSFGAYVPRTWLEYIHMYVHRLGQFAGNFWWCPGRGVQIAGQVAD